MVSRASIRRNGFVGAVVVGVLGLVLAGCVSPSSGGGKSTAPNVPSSGLDKYVLTPDKVAADSSATITVWTDDARKPGFEAFQKAHPELKLNLQIVDGTQYLTKIQLANRSGSGWPDIIFPSGPDQYARLASKQYDYFTQPLDGIIPDATLKDFGPNLSLFTYGGHVVALRNDIAPSVLYYNTATLKKFGYSVPKTMDEYVTLADKVSKEHPGYLMQVNGDVGQTYLQYYQSSGCPYAQLVNPTTVRINFQDPKCVRASKVIDKLVADKVLSTATLSDAQHQALGSSGKVLMTINANWRADFTWSGWNWPKGTLGVAPMPTWGSGDENDRVGNEGGGAYIVSRHSKNMKGAIEAVEFMTTQPGYQLTAPTLPAYQPLQQKWLDTSVPKNLLYADPKQAAAVFQESAPRLDTVNSWIAVDIQGGFPVDQLRSGKSLAGGVAATFQSLLTKQAKAAGYTVENE